MLKFSSEKDLSQINIENPAYSVISKLMTMLIAETNYPYDSETDGFIALVEPDDTELCGNGYWEGITKMDDVSLALYHVNEQCGIIFVIPDTNEDFPHCIEIH